MIIEARILNDTHILFETQVLHMELKLELSLSTNGQDFTNSGMYIYFLFSPKITNITPPFGHDLGGETIIIFGSGFFPFPDISCFFIWWKK